ncbi:hypothetical protein [Streptomyces sp. NPDC091215]|uniref:hypothetical protein n=1 Tax=Streptomyces sp. NPDC091215 TaxID=3155192 RepID=UPI00341FF35A
MLRSTPQPEQMMAPRTPTSGAPHPGHRTVGPFARRGTDPVVVEREAQRAGVPLTLAALVATSAKRAHA